MSHHDPKHIADIICATLGSGSGSLCLFAFDVMPLLIQVLSLVSIMMSIIWFGVRFYDRFFR